MGQRAEMRMLLPVGRSPWAIAAGYFGLCSVLLVPAIPALVCGLLGYRDIKKSAGGPNPKFGMGRAVFGIVAGVVGTVVLIALMVSFLLEEA